MEREDLKKNILKELDLISLISAKFAEMEKEAIEQFKLRIKQGDNLHKIQKEVGFYCKMLTLSEQRYRMEKQESPDKIKFLQFGDVQIGKVSEKRWESVDQDIILSCNTNNIWTVDMKQDHYHDFTISVAPNLQTIPMLQWDKDDSEDPPPMQNRFCHHIAPRYVLVSVDEDKDMQLMKWDLKASKYINVDLDTMAFHYYSSEKSKTGQRYEQIETSWIGATEKIKQSYIEKVKIHGCKNLEFPTLIHEIKLNHGNWSTKTYSKKTETSYYYVDYRISLDLNKKNLFSEEGFEIYGTPPPKEFLHTIRVYPAT